MAKWSDLKSAVASIIKTNGAQEITGQLLQNVLNNIISNVGLNSTFAGIANPDTNPGTPDGNVFYLATKEGTYSNFNGIVINSGEAVILEWKGSWVKKTSGFSTKENLKETAAKYGSLLTDITLSYSSNAADTFTFDEIADTLKINDKIYLYPAENNRIEIDDSIVKKTIEIGLASYSSGTRIIAFDSNDNTIKSIIPGHNIKENNLYFFCIVQKVPYRAGNVNYTKYEIHTKNNVHREVYKYFDGIYSTNNDSPYFGLNEAKKPGVYIRRDFEQSRGGLVFVSVTNNVITQAMLEVNTAGDFVIQTRKFNNDTQSWGGFSAGGAFEGLNFPAASLNGTITFENTKMSVSGTLYLYTNKARYTLPNSAELTLTTALTRLVWDRNTNTISDAVISYFTGEKDKVTIGFLVRDSDGNIKKLVSNIAAQNIIYPTDSKNLYAKEYIPSNIKYIPHRGVRDTEIPENTTYSVMFAALYGLKYSECDVRYTSDGIGVVMHDTTINRTMYNSDLSAISGDVSIAGNTYEDLSQYVYKSTNEVYRTRLQTMKEYIDACAQWDICPIIQGSMSDDDLSYCMQRLGDNWICYGGNFAKVRAYSQNVLCLTSASYDSVDAMVAALKNIGGNVGLSRLFNSELTDEYIAACKANRWEVMASYAYEHSNIPDAIRRGATIILSDNVGKDTNKVLASSLKNWESFTHNGTISANTLVLSTGQYLNKDIEGKGSYKIYIQFTGEGTITLPNYDNAGNYGRLTFPMNNGVFIYTFTLLEEEGFTLSIDTTSTMSIERFIICCEEVAL